MEALVETREKKMKKNEALDLSPNKKAKRGRHYLGIKVLWPLRFKKNINSSKNLEKNMKSLKFEKQHEPKMRKRKKYIFNLNLKYHK